MNGIKEFVDRPEGNGNFLVMTHKADVVIRLTTIIAGLVIPGLIKIMTCNIYNYYKAVISIPKNMAYKSKHGSDKAQYNMMDYCELGKQILSYERHLMRNIRK